MHAHQADPGVGWRSSAVLRKVLAQAEASAASDLPLVIQGESGTGKARLARWVHDRSVRAWGPYQSIDCASIPPAIFGRELFGHEVGAFTGAEQRHTGRLRSAAGGTVLLDRIDGLEASCQRQLLRVFEHGEVLPLGATRAEKLDVRMVQTCQRPLRECVAAGDISEELYYRINVLALALPPLRERRADLPALIDDYLSMHARRLRRAPPCLSAEVQQLFQRYPWPGNLPELEHALVATLTLCPADRVTVSDLPAELRTRLREPDQPTSLTFSIPGRLPFHAQVQAFERALLLRHWGECDSDRATLLQRLALSPHQLRYLLTRLGLELPPTKPL